MVSLGGAFMISEFLGKIVDIVWGPSLVFLLIGGGIYLLLLSRLVPLTAFAHAVKLIAGKFHHDKDKDDKGQINHFQALCNALAATVGLGNIGGVAVAIQQGGPGAIFWMWVAAFIGMNTKFFECTLAVMFRGQDYKGEVQGGPMYVIEKAFPKKLKFLGVAFAIFGLLGTQALFQVNQLAAYLDSQYHVDKLLVGIICAIFVGYVLLGGVRRMASFNSKIVPVMCGLYIAFCIVIISLNFSAVPALFGEIFRQAFNPDAIWGGAAGYGVLKVLQIGVKRAAFSNEAGVGTAPMAHSNVKTSEPISEGLVAMFGPFLDTIIVCTMTALVILLNFPEAASIKDEGVLLTLAAFENSLPGIGGYFLGLSIVLFSISTMIGMSNYNEKCWNYLFKGRKYLAQKTHVAMFCSALILGAIFELSDIVNLLDIGYGLMAWPNMICTLALAPKVTKELKKYLKSYVRN